MQWFRWHHGTVSDPKFRTIARKAGQPVAAVIAVWAALLEHASQEEDRGTIRGIDLDDVASALDMETEAVEAVVSVMQNKVLDGETLTGWDKRQPKREDSSAERVKAYRERQRTQGDDTKRDVTQCNAPDTDSDTDKNIPPSPSGDVPPKREKRKVGSRLPDDWQPSPDDVAFAEQHGVNATTEAANFRDYWRAKTGKDATKLDWPATWRRWVRKAAEQKPKSRDPTTPIGIRRDETQATDAEWSTRVRKFRQTGLWFPSYGPRPDTSTTKVPPHILKETAP